MNQLNLTITSNEISHYFLRSSFILTLIQNISNCLAGKENLLKKIRNAILIFYILAQQTSLTWAAGEYRFDKMLLHAILIFLQKCSFITLVLGLAFYLMAYKNTDGPKKADSLKVIGVSIFLYSLPALASASGLI